MKLICAKIATILIGIVLTNVAHSHNSVVVIPMGGDNTTVTENPAIVYTGVAPISVVTDLPNDAGTISFDVNSMPVLPISKIPAIDLHQPSLGVNCVIALVGLFPSRNSADPFIGDMMYVGFNFAPRGWSFCNGQLIAISQNETLYSLLGTTYGGDGRTTFALPDLRGRVPVHAVDGAGPGLPNWRQGQRFGRQFSSQ